MPLLIARLSRSSPHTPCPSQMSFPSIQNTENVLIFKAWNKPHLMFKERWTFSFIFVTWFFSAAHEGLLFVMIYFQESCREQSGNLTASGYCHINFSIIKWRKTRHDHMMASMWQKHYWKNIKSIRREKEMNYAANPSSLFWGLSIVDAGSWPAVASTAYKYSWLGSIISFNP